ncbi:hypothetical protein LY632_03065 [Erythrobacter sp. SDW2]|uniref:hypothetical protein n=1 Tax=Erythrobacter sp. SDW2 TaxID=2907154 RepID=UPI001F37D01A|nr:hypothetical protein [Erythrobacter sp. SDW2]UIP07393.1 hypothetical protein LY632_03065 [Erythrobacter sp. SDW2]
MNMYESTFEIPGQTDAVAEQALAAIAWPVLVARLSARRDLRCVLLAGEAGAAASFNPAAAAMLSQWGVGKRDVNRDVLAHGKYPWANGVAPPAAAGDREF